MRSFHFIHCQVGKLDLAVKKIETGVKPAVPTVTKIFIAAQALKKTAQGPSIHYNLLLKIPSDDYFRRASGPNVCLFRYA